MNFFIRKLVWIHIVECMQDPLHQLHIFNMLAVLHLWIIWVHMHFLEQCNMFQVCWHRRSVCTLCKSKINSEIRTLMLQCSYQAEKNLNIIQLCLKLNIWKFHTALLFTTFDFFLNNRSLLYFFTFFLSIDNVNIFSNLKSEMQTSEGSSCWRLDFAVANKWAFREILKIETFSSSSVVGKLKSNKYIM